MAHRGDGGVMTAPKATARWDRRAMANNREKIARDGVVLDRMASERDLADRPLILAEDRRSRSLASAECRVSVAARPGQADPDVDLMIAEVAMRVRAAAGRCGLKRDSHVAADQEKTMVSVDRVVQPRLADRAR